MADRGVPASPHNTTAGEVSAWGADPTTEGGSLVDAAQPLSESSAPAVPHNTDTLAEVENLARAFHDAYERLAPTFGYTTRRESAVPWEDVPAENRSLMIAVVGEVVAPELAARARAADQQAQLLERMAHALDILEGSLRFAEDQEMFDQEFAPLLAEWREQQGAP